MQRRVENANTQRAKGGRLKYGSREWSQCGCQNQKRVKQTLLEPESRSDLEEIVEQIV